MIDAEWVEVGTPFRASDGWDAVRERLGALERLPSKHAVYVVRVQRPFSIFYPKRPSPLLYIGEGNPKRRFYDHMRNWVVDLAHDLPNLTIQMKYADIEQSRKGRNRHKDVEADLLVEFVRHYGAIPLLNRKTQNTEKSHKYSKGFFRVIHPGRGRGYRWALSPLRSNSHYIREYEIVEQ